MGPDVQACWGKHTRVRRLVPLLRVGLALVTTPLPGARRWVCSSPSRAPRSGSSSSWREALRRGAVGPPRGGWRAPTQGDPSAPVRRFTLLLSVAPASMCHTALLLTRAIDLVGLLQDSPPSRKATPLIAPIWAGDPRTHLHPSSSSPPPDLATRQPATPLLWYCGSQYLSAPPSGPLGATTCRQQKTVQVHGRPGAPRRNRRA